MQQGLKLKRSVTTLRGLGYAEIVAVKVFRIFNSAHITLHTRPHTHAPTPPSGGVEYLYLLRCVH